MEIQIAGQLYWGEELVYDLVDPHPMIEREHWMKDTDEKFKVVMFGKVFDIVVSRPFLVSYRKMGQRVKINADTMKEELVDKVDFY